MTVDFGISQAHPLELAWGCLSDGRCASGLRHDDAQRHEAKLAAAASSYFGMALPADAVEVGERLRAEQDALANNESLPLEERLQAAFRPFNGAARPWRY